MYLALLCDIDFSGAKGNEPVVTILDQRKFEVADEDALEGQDSPEALILRLEWNKMRRSERSPVEIDRASPWINLEEEERMVFSLNETLIDLFRIVE
jgi:hypothetical protein